MSGRLLRRVLKEQEEQHQRLPRPDEEDEEEEAESPVSRSPARNLFDLLNDQENEPEISDETSAGDVDEQELAMPKSSVKVLPASTNKSKKKKKKNKQHSKTKDESEEQLDAILQALNLDDRSGDSANRKAETTRSQEILTKQQSPYILSVNPKLLRPENELRKIFGSDVVRSFENSHNSSSSRQVRGGRRGTYTARKMILVSPSSHWPRWDGSLSMEHIETKAGKHFFRYVHSSSYRQAQQAFEAAKAIHDLNGIASILAYHPYHVESLLTIAEVLKFSGEHESSANAISKCLFALECAWHPMFDPFQGNCELKYSHDTNKTLFSILFTHMQNMDRRGCHRSALEVCKLLLSLDSDDPKGSLFCIDYFALRSGEYSWLQRFSEEYSGGNSLWLYPNFSYSLAICRFYLEREASSKNAALEDDQSTSADLMKQALMLHPSVLKKLVDKAPLKDPAWTKILKHAFFGSADAGGLSLEHLINIYIERSYIMWRLPELQTLLRDAAWLVIESLDRKESDAKDLACVRKEFFSSEKNEYSHLLVSDFSGSVPTMPPEELQNFMIDPQMAHGMQNADQGNNVEPAPQPREVVNRNPVAVFLESMLPWVDYGVAHNDNHLDGHDEENEE
ncbi:hypothetical protein Scep_025141 [Stephania cephalantha]|uniref:Transcription factor 25 n=1 Tax=Stephania cephalantha TaxID=152367 RepID=A0AAP0HQZ1_9MAGN